MRSVLYLNYYIIFVYVNNTGTATKKRGELSPKTLVFRIVFPMLFIIALLYLLRSKFDLSSLLSSLAEMNIEWKGVYLALTIMLAYFNWMLEARKWQLAMQQFNGIDWSTAFKSVLVGVSVGIFTPAKIGEYVGRMWLLKNEDKTSSTLATLVCSLAQMTVTLFIGLIALFFLVHEFQLVDLKFNLLLLAAGISITVIVVVYLFLPELIRRLSRVDIFKGKLSKYSKLEFSKSLLIRVLQLSTLRYLVYTIQYLFVFYFLGVEYTCLVFMGHIALVFLMQSLLPLPPFAALIGRGGIALLVFSNLGIHEIVILSATLIIWVINLILPALCGMIIVSKYGSKVYS